MLVEIVKPVLITGAPIDVGNVGAVIDVLEGYKGVIYYNVEFGPNKKFWFEESDFKVIAEN